MRRLGALAVLGAWAAGCSSGSANSSVPGGPGGPITTGQGFCDGTIGALIRYLDQSCSAADKQTDSYQFIYAFTQAAALSCPGILQKSFDQGRASLNADAAGDCADGYEALFASGGYQALESPDPALLAACNGAVTGKQPLGAPCAQPYECQNGATCVGFTSSADGVCAQPAIGEACGAGESTSGEISLTFSFGDHPDCAGEAFCDSVLVNDEFVDQCVAKLASGESCFDDEECAAGLGCYVGVCQTGGPSAIGGECADDDDCESTAYCDSSGASGVCAAKKATGQTCSGSILGGSECIGTCNVPEGADTGTCVSFCGAG
jgi:hypothetical protein